MKQSESVKKVMRIGIDARPIYQTGVGVYIRNLLHHLPSYAPEDWDIRLIVMETDKKRVREEFPHYGLECGNYRWHSISEQIAFATRLQQLSFDLVHFTYFSYPMVYRRPFISTIHDLTPLMYKTGNASTLHPLLYTIKHKALEWVLHSAVVHSKSVITPTKVVKNALIRYWGDRYSDKIHPIYEGLDATFEQARAKNVLNYRYPSKYLLYVGNFYPHKNVQRLLRAVALTQHELVLIGPYDNFAKEIWQVASRLGVEKRVHMLHKATSADVKYAFAHATALVHPAIVEGFGLTILEALSQGCPVVASDIPVFQELYKGAYTPFAPLEVDSIIAALQTLKNKKNVSDGAQYVKKYSFATMTKQTVQQYKAALT